MNYGKVVKLAKQGSGTKEASRLILIKTMKANVRTVTDITCPLQYKEFNTCLLTKFNVAVPK